MNTSLTTFDGYPRDDLDIAQSVYHQDVTVVSCQQMFSTYYEGTHHSYTKRLQGPYLSDRDWPA